MNFEQILKKISKFDGTCAGAITLVTRTVSDAGNPGLGTKPTYTEAETTISGYIAPFKLRLFQLVNAQEVDADFQLISDTDITNIKTSHIKYDGDTYYIVQKDSPKLMPYQDCFIYMLKLKAGQG